MIRTTTTTIIRAAVAALLAVAALALAAPAPASAQEEEPPASGFAYSPRATWSRDCEVRFDSPSFTLWTTDNGSLDGLAAMRCDDVAVIQVFNVKDPDPGVAERPHDLQVLFVTYLVQAPDVVCAARIDGFVHRRVGIGVFSTVVPRTLTGCGATVQLPNQFLFSCLTQKPPVGHRCGQVLNP